MNKKQEKIKQGLVPRLRFAEFKDDGEWVKKKLQDVFSFKYGVGNTNPSNGGAFPVYGANGITGGYTEYNAENSIIIGHMGTTGSVFWEKNKHFVTYNGTITKPKNVSELGIAFGYNLLVQLNLNTLLGCTGYSFLSYEMLNKVQTAIPELSEQQKIADTLSSLDIIITTQEQKIQKLEEHKKALLQKLFPPKGKSVPFLRFAEFENDGDWEEFRIETLVKNEIIFAPKDGNHGNLHPKSGDYVSHGIPFIMANDIRNGVINFFQCSHITKNQADNLQKGFAQEGDVLLTHKGTVGEVAIIEKNEFPYLMLTPQVTYYRIRKKKRMLNLFLKYFFMSERFQSELDKVSGGGTRAYIGITEQQKLFLVMPNSLEEQQRIADCLSSLDELITAHGQKLALLKQHKKGLMQGLFPMVKH